MYRPFFMSAVLSLLPKLLRMTNQFLDLLSQPRAYRHAVAVYALPGETVFTAMVQDLEAEETGREEEFWFHPFAPGPDQAALIIRPHRVETWDGWLPAADMPTDFWPFLYPEQLPQTRREEFTGAIVSARECFAGGALEKVMLSRLRHCPLPAGFNPLALLVRLRQAYPNAFVSYVSTPLGGTWVGATPETLLAAEGNEVRTISLAGTRVNNGDTRWTEKEYHEQELVSRFIREIVDEFNPDTFTTEGPSDLVIGHLVHLHTAFHARFAGVPDKTLLMRLVQALHPTPAVGGYPQAGSLPFIAAHEPHARFYYSGFLGPVLPGNRLRFFVNLRCMTLTSDQAYVFAGAGITSGSDAALEWEETGQKSEMVMKFLSESR